LSKYNKGLIGSKLMEEKKEEDIAKLSIVEIQNLLLL